MKSNDIHARFIGIVVKATNRIKGKRFSYPLFIFAVTLVFSVVEASWNSENSFLFTLSDAIDIFSFCFNPV